MKLIKILLLSALILTGCGTVRTGNAPVDAAVNTTTAILKSENNCNQGHKQDRLNCEKRKKEQVNEIKESIKNATKQ